MGLFDKVCSAETHLAHPALYATKNTGESSFNIKVILMIFTLLILLSYTSHYVLHEIVYAGVLDLDCKRFNTFIPSLLVILNGAKGGRDMVTR